MVIIMKTNKLLDEEKAIEDNIEALEPISEIKRKKIENILEQARKNKSISLRISSYDLEKLKEKAQNEGIPYQTLINSILHKYITNQLYDKDQIFKSFKLLTET
ncbi:BrnA antitoxin family protein [candidate division KSB1 bacterium]|nr:BrnA antitoxin family protein [candidate division KSB1 bacterium]